MLRCVRAQVLVGTLALADALDVCRNALGVVKVHVETAVLQMTHAYIKANLDGYRRHMSFCWCFLLVQFPVLSSAMSLCYTQHHGPLMNSFELETPDTQVKAPGGRHWIL